MSTHICAALRNAWWGETSGDKNEAINLYARVEKRSSGAFLTPGARPSGENEVEAIIPKATFDTRQRMIQGLSELVIQTTPSREGERRGNRGFGTELFLGEQHTICGLREGISTVRLSPWDIHALS